MILSAHQPAYLPWLGYFDKIKRCDLFVYVDDVQFEKASFINRNQVKTPNGPTWLTVAVQNKGSCQKDTMLDLKIDDRCQWQRKHLRSFQVNYSKAKNYALLYPKLEKLYEKSYDLLTDLCWDHLMFWLDYLNIKTKIVRLSDYPIEGKKSDFVLNLCRYFGANYFISGALGKDYLVQSDFQKNNITIEFQNYKTPYYQQLHGEFVPNLSVIDYCMNAEGLL